MTSAQAYGALRKFGRPIIETREASVLLGTSLSNASRILRAMADAGSVRRIRGGLWAIDPMVHPFVAVPYLTAPFPAYVSLWSALAYHDMIEQIPARTYVVSLARTQEIPTGLGQYSIHHLVPEVFGGFEGEATDGYIATPEKALFDTLYIRSPRGGKVYLPELALPEGFDEQELERWAERIPSARLRTIVTRNIERALQVALA